MVTRVIDKIFEKILRFHVNYCSRRKVHHLVFSNFLLVLTIFSFTEEYWTLDYNSIIPWSFEISLSLTSFGNSSGNPYLTFNIFINNHHGAETSVIWIVERSVIQLLISIRYYGKTNFEVQINFSANTTLVALFEIRFRSLFLDLEKKDNEIKLQQYLEIFHNRFVQERCFRQYRDWNKLMINQ